MMANMRLEDSKSATAVQVSLRGTQTLVIDLLFGLYCLTMMACFLLQFVADVNVNWYYECIIHLIPNCNICFVWIVAQHYCVLGLCLTALEWHRMMLGYAHRGLGECRCLVPIIANSCVALLRLIIRSLDGHIDMSIVVELPEAFLPLFFSAVQPCQETIRLPLWLEICDRLKLLIKFLK